MVRLMDRRSPPTAHSLGSSALAGSLSKLWPLPRTVHGWIRLVAGRCGWMRMDVDAQGASLLWVLIHPLAFAGLQRDIHMLAPPPGARVEARLPQDLD
ncbi:hypothetical protein E4U43_002792 [Claviceps pusilla]|uniref:Uncharacterized protein n=1 Tax=Claviceps pusilla TaxID=123648 RepID=A0A9P7SV16_9HYPO|nr:hypothetical protein E4U43_002792 [Claviceps pusilla]